MTDDVSIMSMFLVSLLSACAGERDEVRSDESEKIKSNLVSKLNIGYVQKSSSRIQTWEPNFTDG